uniref:Uncharacterized protein n=1 Tax=Tanacetum cinerariifolium TaxID=118510 RepID=A0A6L2JQX8_TANCI|nr:hypothetical protein [Tanacetum cinerariifolium]
MVLVVKPYELFRGRTPALSFMRPFGCHVTILNTLNHLGKFDGKSNEGFFFGYSTNSKAFRVYNTRTRKVEENLHIKFLKYKPLIAGHGPKWLFDINTLTKSMDYVPVIVGTNSNDFAGKGASFDADQSSMKTGSSQDYILMPLWNEGSLFDSSLKDSDGNNKDNDSPSTKSEIDIKRWLIQKTVVKIQSDDFFGADNDMTSLDGVEVDISNISTTYPVSTTPNTRIHKDYSLDNVIGDIQSGVQTRRMTVTTDEQGVISAIYEEKTHKDVHTCSFACFLSQEEPKRITNALKDIAWVEAMKEELLQSHLQKVWTLVDLPRGKSAMGTKWVFRNKKDERGIVIRNKARLVAQGCTQEEGINYDEVIAPVARIKTIRLFLAYASFYGIPWFEDPDYLGKVYKVEKALYGLHQAPRACARSKLWLPLPLLRLNMWQLLVVVDKYSGFRINSWIMGAAQHIWLSLILDNKMIKYELLNGLTLDNGEIELNTTVDGQVKTITVASIRRHLKLADANGISSLPTTKFFEQLTLMGKTKTIIRRMCIRIPQSNVPTSGADEAITKEMHDGLGRATTTASSLEVELGSDEVTHLENKITSTKVVYNNALITLTKRLKKLEKKLKNKIRRAVIDSLEEEEASSDHEDSPKQERMIKEIDKDENVNQKRSASKDKGKAIMQESESPKTIKKKEMLQISLDEEIAQRFYEEEQAHILRDEEYAQQVQAQWITDKVIRIEGIPKVSRSWFLRMLFVNTMKSIRRFVQMESEGQAADFKGGEGSSKAGQSLKRSAKKELGQEQKSSLFDAREVSIHMLVKKKYLLPQDTLGRMLQWKLHVNYNVTEMAYELLRFIRSQLNHKGEDDQKYGISILNLMMNYEIKNSDASLTYLALSTNVEPPKVGKGKGKGKSHMGKKKDDTPAPKGKKSAPKNKSIITTKDNINPDPMETLKLGKSISLTEAEEQDKQKRVHETHERLVTEKTSSDEESDVADDKKFDKEKDKSKKAYDEIADEEQTNVDHDDEVKEKEEVANEEIVDEEIADEAKDNKEIIDTYKADKEMVDAEKLNVEKTEEEKVDEEQTGDDQAHKEA